MRLQLYRRAGKRLLDLTVSISALALLWPVMLVVAAAVYFRLGAPVMFRQVRPGRNEALFTVLKFRTMQPDTDPGGAVTDAERLTPFGQWLRSTSLDEVPELLNVVRGEMSLVGPRPLLERYLPRYSARHRRRHEVRPGLTGLTQVNGRNLLSWDAKLDLDVDYVDRYSLGLDLSILARTVLAVLRREGITQEGMATTEEFHGSERER